MAGLRASESLHSYPNQLIAEVIANAQQILQAAVNKLKKKCNSSFIKWEAGAKYLAETRDR